MQKELTGAEDGGVGFVPQRMVRWLGPKGLAITALQVLLSTIFGAYSDKREIQAALKDPGEHDLSGKDELWFDFLADTGDGFDPTYTTACLLRTDIDLTHQGVTHATRRAELLVLGGDLAYPAATPATYRDRLSGLSRPHFRSPPTLAPGPRCLHAPATMTGTTG